MLYLNNCGNYNLFNNCANQLRSDVYEENDTYNLSVEIPGFNKEEIKIDFDDDVLTISASKAKDDNNYLINEFKFNNVSRSYYFENVDPDSITAKLSDGILYVTLKKKEIVETKKIIAIE